MRKQLLFTTDYTAYTDQVDNINWDAVSTAIREEFFFTLNNLAESDKAAAWAANFSLGLWYGSRTGSAIFPDLVTAIGECIDGLAEFDIRVDARGVHITGVHHDGRNSFDLLPLSEIGKDRHKRNGQISLQNRQNLMSMDNALQF